MVPERFRQLVVRLGTAHDQVDPAGLLVEAVAWIGAFVEGPGARGGAPAWGPASSPSLAPSSLGPASAAETPGAQAVVAGVLAEVEGLARSSVLRSPADVVALVRGPVPFRPDYDDPAMSYLHRVLEGGRGLPVSLAVLSMAVGEQADQPLVGVGMPGHFLVRAAADEGRFFNPLHPGRALDATDCAVLFSALHPGVPFRTDYLDPVGPLDIVHRVLANLRGVHRRRGNRTALVRTIELVASVPGAPDDTDVALANALSEAGRFRQAADVLDRLAADLERDAGGDAPAAAAQVLRFRAASRGLRARDN